MARKRKETEEVETEEVEIPKTIDATECYYYGKWRTLRDEFLHSNGHRVEGLASGEGESLTEAIERALEDLESRNLPVGVFLASPVIISHGSRWTIVCFNGLQQRHREKTVHVFLFRGLFTLSGNEETAEEEQEVLRRYESEFRKVILEQFRLFLFGKGITDLQSEYTYCKGLEEKEWEEGFNLEEKEESEEKEAINA
jgi:hypothetical protein